MPRPTRASSLARRARRTRAATALATWRDDHWVPWAHVAPIAALVHAARPPSGTPVLVIGVPRGGTSWVGHVLGSATGCAYLREPLTQSRPVRREGMGWVEGCDGPPDGALVALADRALAGTPAFTRRVVGDRRRWSVRRAGARLVLKEVNPLWLGWLVERRPLQVVHLVRHPAAVASSWQALGWLGTPPPTPPLDEDLAALGAAADDWERHGAWQAALHRRAADAARRTEHLTVRYEDLAVDPLGAFADLFAALGLPWDDHARSLLAALAVPAPGAGPFDVRRDGAQRAEAWRSELTDAQRAAIRRGWDALDPPWYRADDDW